jgi:hypothetical protein
MAPGKMRLQKLHVFAECGRLCVLTSSSDKTGAKSRAPLLGISITFYIRQKAFLRPL